LSLISSLWQYSEEETVIEILEVCLIEEERQVVWEEKYGKSA